MSATRHGADISAMSITRASAGLSPEFIFVKTLGRALHADIATRVEAFRDDLRPPKLLEQLQSQRHWQRLTRSNPHSVNVSGEF
jgi:hypothetical protein